MGDFKYDSFAKLARNFNMRRNQASLTRKWRVQVHLTQAEIVFHKTASKFYPDLYQSKFLDLSPFKHLIKPPAQKKPVLTVVPKEPAELPKVDSIFMGGAIPKPVSLRKPVSLKKRPKPAIKALVQDAAPQAPKETAPVSLKKPSDAVAAAPKAEAAAPKPKTLTLKAAPALAKPAPTAPAAQPAQTAPRRTLTLQRKTPEQNNTAPAPRGTLSLGSKPATEKAAMAAFAARTGKTVAEAEKPRRTLSLKREVAVTSASRIKTNSSTQDLAKVFKSEMHRITEKPLEEVAATPAVSASRAFTVQNRKPSAAMEARKQKTWAELEAEAEALIKQEKKKKPQFDLASAFKTEMQALMAEQAGETAPRKSAPLSTAFGSKRAPKPGMAA
ncbi:MAG: hypothetical protein OXT65_02120 [Alphaproteobacteria bacterium]|nr:hypothetical protein [Alphaproteobacteria bacterium]